MSVHCQVTTFPPLQVLRLHHVGTKLSYLAGGFLIRDGLEVGIVVVSVLSSDGIS